MSNITLRIKKNSDTGEYMVQYFVNGKYSEAKTYYGTDRVDAIMTEVAMKVEAEKQGHKVTIKD